MLKVAIIIGSTRPGRKAEAVARWVYDIAAKRGDASFEVVDIADFELPLLDEAISPVMHQYEKPHTKAWAAKIETFDAFVFVTPEYNHSTSGALKNAIDFLFREWNDKAAGLSATAESVDACGRASATHHGRDQGCRCPCQVALSLYTDFENFSTFKPGPRQEAAVNAMLDDLVPWGEALQAVRMRNAKGSAQ